MDIHCPESAFDGESRTSFVKMFVLGIIVTLPCILGGMMESYSAVALPQMKLNIDETTWFSSVPGFISPVGIVMISFMVDAFGRKRTLIFAILPAALGWILIFLNVSVSLTLLGRALTGMTTGVMFYPAQVYVAECITVNHPHLRSSFITWGGISNAFGIFLIFVLAFAFDYLLIAVITAGIAIILLLLICAFVPESPVWLYLQGRIGDAEMSEKKLRIVQPILRECRQDKEVGQSYGKMVSKMKPTYPFYELLKITRKDIYKPLLIISVAEILSTCTGGFALLSYMVQIMDDNATGESFLHTAASSANTNDSDAYMYSLFSGVLIIVARFVTAIALPVLGAKKMTFFTVVLMIVGLLMMGFSGVLKNHDPHSNTNYLNLFGIWTATFAFHAGVYSTPLSILSDVFPADAKGFAGVPLVTVALSAAFVDKLHPYLSIDFGGYVFFGYGVVGVVYLVFALCYLPETVGKTLDQINAEFR